MTRIGPVPGQPGHQGSCKEALSLQVDKHTKPQATAPPSLGAVPWRGLEECVPLQPLELRVFRGMLLLLAGSTMLDWFVREGPR